MVLLKDICKRGTPTSPVFLVHPKSKPEPVILESTTEEDAAAEVRTKYGTSVVVITLSI